MPWWFWGGEICPKCCSCQAGLQKVHSKATARGTRRAHCTLQCVWRGHLIASREAAQQSSTGQMAKQRRENKPMGSHGSFAGDTCRIMWHFAHFGGDDSKSVTDWNRCFNQSWRQCQEENKFCYTAGSYTLGCQGGSVGVGGSLGAPESGLLRAPESGPLGTPKSDTHRDIRDT